MTLYNDLGITKDADAADVKKAYRRKAREHHPDKGGSTEAFQAIAHAYEVLSDPARRSHYDKTGDHGQAAADVELQNMLSLLAKYLISGVMNAPSVEHIDIRKAVSIHIWHEIEKMQDERNKAKQALEHMSKASKRFTRKKEAVGDDMVQMVFEGHRQMTERAIADLENKINFRKRLIELLDTYTYAIEPSLQPSAVSYATYQMYGFGQR